MVGKTSVLLFASAIALSSLPAHAQTSLYLPGFDDQPLSASVLGTDSNGRTTWEIVQGTPTASGQEESFPATATLIEGPNDAVISYSAGDVQALESCALSNGVANCNIVANQDGEPFTAEGTETVSYMVVGFAAPTGSPSTTEASMTPKVSTSGGSGTGSGTAASPSKTSGALGLKQFASGFAGILAAGAILCLL